jgi:hypothetical protein
MRRSFDFGSLAIGSSYLDSAVALTLFVVWLL